MELTQDYFVRSWMYHVTESPYSPEISDTDQLRLEGRLRKTIVQVQPDVLSAYISKDWKPWYSHGSIFVSASDFYPTLCRISMETAATLYLAEDDDVEFVLWSYMAATMYLDGQKLCVIPSPGYKPIKRITSSIRLKAGQHDVVIILDNLGARDTRNMVALQVKSSSEIITSFPESDKVYSDACSFLDGIEIKDNNLYFPYPCPKGTMFENIAITGHSFIKLPEGRIFTIELLGMKRSFEILPPCPACESISFKDIMRNVADSLGKTNNFFSLSCFPLLAKRTLGETVENECGLLKKDFEHLALRGDCSDFVLVCLLRYFRQYGMEKDTLQQFRTVVLNYRYWMTMDGTDCLCFWSENHALMFYFAAYEAGELFGTDYFPRAQMTGHALSEWGKNRIEAWLDDVLECGFEEFLSSNYALVTFIALLSVYDYVNECKAKAKCLMDRLLVTLSMHTFKGSVIAPMGREYRAVITPYESSIQSLLKLINPSVPYYPSGSYWLTFLATTDYKMPDDLARLMSEPCLWSGYEGNAFIRTEKNKGYCLSSVDTGRTRCIWSREDDPQRPLWVKSINESFHGTTRLKSGIYGYQQHLWSAALSPDTLVFANHPGDTTEATGMRPGYWNGNGVMPAVLPFEGGIASIYSIPETHPVHFTHLFFPEIRFDEVCWEDDWIFARKDEGLMAIWCSEVLVPYDEVLHGFEFRAYSDDTAYLVLCSENESFETFKDKAKVYKPEFNRITRTLSLKGQKALCFEYCEDKTQFVE